MASILTNTSAMVALQNLRTINSNLVDTQNQIATGKKIATAKDNSAIWAVSKVLESDVNAFKAVNDSLNLGDSTVAVARQASETVSDILTELKGNIVAAQEENVDRSKIQADIDAQVEQIQSIVSAAQFNGLSLVEGTEQASIVGSLERTGTGAVTASEIAILRQDLTTSAGTFGSGTSLNANVAVSDATSNALNNDGNTAVITFNTNADYSAATASFTIGGVVASFAAGDLGTGNQDAAASAFAAKVNALGIEGITAAAAGADVTLTSTRAFEDVNVTVDSVTGNAAGTQITALNGTGSLTLTTGDISERAESLTFDQAAAVKEGDGYRVTFGGETFTYVAGPNETFEDVARGLQAAIGGTELSGISTSVDQDASGDYVLKIDNASDTDLTLAAIGNEDGVASGGLFGLEELSVLTNDSAAAALTSIDTFLNTAIDASASFGSAQSRIELQSDFIGKLTDSIKTGIGSLVDADLEAASARLQALQVQQQLGTQSLSIANRAPQSILALFQ